MFEKKNDDWVIKEVYNMLTKGSKGKTIKPIRHKIFLLCAQIEEIQHWVVLFTNCAYGKFPTGVSYKNGIMYFRQKRRNTSKSYKIPDSADQACPFIKGIFREDVGIVTTSEYMEARIHTRTVLKELVPVDDPHWSMIKSPIVKDRMISQFCYKRGRKLGLSRKGCDLMNKTINIGLLCKTIRPSDINIKEFEIESINGLEENDFYYIVPVDENRKKKIIPIQRQTKKPQLSMVNEWDKYCEIRM